MSKSSAKRRKASAQTSPRQSTKEQAGAPSKGRAKAPAKANPKAAKHRGPWLTGALALMTAGAVVSAVLPFYYHKNTVDIQHPGFIAAAMAVGLLGLAGVILMWLWKRVGIYAFLASVAGSIVVGMFVYPSMVMAFHAIVPLLILSAALSVDRKLPLFE